jgi:hypothetical protein
MYNVVGFPDSEGGKFGVLVDDKVTELTPSAFPLWSGRVAGATTSSHYQYVQLSSSGHILKKESFVRSFNNPHGRDKTLNEHFDRSIMYTALPKIPQILTDVRPKPSRAFDDTQIGTIHLKTDPARLEDMLAHPLETDRKPIGASFRFINADSVYSSESIKIKVSGHGSRKYQKLSLQIKFDGSKDGKDTFFGRPIIKLRSETSDPTLIREKLYIDILNAVGVATIQGAYVRVYINNKPFGFYLMVEDIDAPFLRTTMQHGSSESEELGFLFKMGSHVAGQEATLQYAGPATAYYNPGVYENKNLGDNSEAEPMAQLIQFFKDLQEFDPSLPGAIKFWNSRLDLEGFLRYMAMEFLGGNWDAYWWKGNNYFMYYNLQQARWQFIPTDFDSTFNDGNLTDVLTTYRRFAAGRLERPGKDHPLITKLILKNNDINRRFEKILLLIVKGVFQPKVLDPRIDAYVTMIQNEVKWDLSISRSSLPGKRMFTVEDFHNNIKRGIQGIRFGIKPWIEDRAASVPSQVSGG